ncbi:MAG: DEAD/DEAH box helicase family protein, partial [Methylococcaceae bacterium]|nr:DEAD/DEAH box helicase family protein [Methylococcaceae bacterium]
MKQNDSPGRKYLRSEAGPLHWSQLDESQLKAFKRLMEMLEEAIDGLPCLDRHEKRTTKKDTIPPWFDFYRENRLVLLHGARGTGKTSVMLSLIDTCMQKMVEEREYLIEQKLHKIRCRTIWLEPLDMEPLPGPANLLAAVLARIETAFKLYIPLTTTQDDCRGPRGILELCPDYLEAFQKLQRIQADVALAWDGNISERGAHLDPDSYAVEVIRAENARLSLNKHLSGTLDDLAKNISSVCGVTNPIFVLPVDDLDLNPTRCLEILRL